MKQFKTCPRCQETKPLDEFYNNNATKDGKTCRCKECLKVNSIKAKKERQIEEIKKAYREAPQLRAKIKMLQTRVDNLTANNIKYYDLLRDNNLI